MDRTQIIRLAETLLTDLEEVSVEVELLVAKALRIARLVSDSEAIEWLNYEATGFDVSTPVGRKYAILARGWNGTDENGYFGAISGVVQTIKSMSHSLEVQKQFIPSGEMALYQLGKKAENVSAWTAAMVPMEKIISAVRTQLHLFGSRVIQEMQFSETSRTIFEHYQLRVDKALASNAGKAFEKLPYVFERLQNGEPEAISHALTSCRRIIDAFADAVFPPQVEPAIVDGKELDCSANKTKNRIRAFTATRIASESRRDRINKNLAALYERVSAGVHSDVSIDEAQALVLNTYLLLGEISSES